MWFKNIQAYRFTKPFSLAPEELAEHLAESHFQACGSQDVSRLGWVPPLGDLGEDYVHVANGYIMICLKRQDKILPAAAVNEVLQDKIQEIQAQDDRKVGRKERQDLKEEIVFSMLPKAFTRSSLLYAYIALKDGMLIVNASSANRAEELCSYLRDTIGSLSLIPLAAKNLPQQVMTNWLLHRQTPDGFDIGHECELRDSLDEKAVIRCKHQDLHAEEINKHLQNGMYATKLGINWQGGVECLIDDKLAIKRLNFSDLIETHAHDADGVDSAAQFDIDFALMTLELSGFFKALLKAFGGEAPFKETSDNDVADRDTADKEAPDAAGGGAEHTSTDESLLEVEAS